MDASRQLGPPRQSDGTPNGQLNSTVQQLGGLSNNSNFPLHHLPPHMQQQLNGPVVRPANMTVSQQTEHVGESHDGPPQHQNLSQGAMMGDPNYISVPSGLGPGSIQQPQQHHLPNAGPPGHLQMPMTRAAMPPQPAPANKIEDPLNKAKQFFNALLTMSKNQTPAMYSTARDLLQQLVDGKINPDMFAQRLQEELKSTPQPILAPLLKACLSKLREGLINGKINIEGIGPPPASARSLPDLSLPLSGLNPSFQTPAQGLQKMGNNIKHSPKIYLRPPAPQPAPQPAAWKAKGLENAQKAAVGAATGSAAAGAPPSSDLHPVFGRLPQLPSHQKTEKAKTTKPPAEKKIMDKQQRGIQMKERRSQVEAYVAASPTIQDPAKEQKEQKDPKADEDELNDVAAMGGVNLTEESAKLSSVDIAGTRARSIEDFLGFGGLADEELAIVLQYLDLIERLQVRRVSRRWRAIMSLIAPTQYIKAADHPDETSPLYRELWTRRGIVYPGPERPSLTWRYRPSGVRTLVVDYSSVETWHTGLRLPSPLARRLLPALTTLCITNYWSCGSYKYKWWYECPYKWSSLVRQLPASVRVVFLNGVVGLLPCDYQNGKIFIRDAVLLGSWLPVERSFMNVHLWCIRIPRLIACGGKGSLYQALLSAATWPYEEEELQWLARSAPCLNRLPKLLYLLMRSVRRFSSIADSTPCKNVVCTEHGLFCEHLDVSHYRQLNGHFRRLISLCILNVRGTETQGLSRSFEDDAYIMKERGPSHLCRWMADYDRWKIGSNR